MKMLTTGGWGTKKKKYLAPKITLPIGHFLLVPHIKKRKKRKKDTDRWQKYSFKNKIEVKVLFFVCFFKFIFVLEFGQWWEVL